MKAPQFSPHRHTGTRLPHHHTSFAALAFITLVGGIILTLVTTGVLAGPPNPQSDSFTISGVVPATPPGPPTIDNPVTGQHFATNPITVEGKCIHTFVVKLYKNGVFGGSTVCANNDRYSLQLDLFLGKNDLIARQLNSVGQESPDSNLVTVFYEPGNPIVPGIPQLILRSDTAYKGAAPGDKITWPAEVIGGRGPYAISWDWGDGTVDLLSLPTAGPFSLDHVYGKPGTYTIKVRATDTSSQQAFLQLTALISGGTGQASLIKRITDGGLLLIAWPIFILLVLMLLSFWLGERYEKWRLDNPEDEQPEPAGAS